MNKIDRRYLELKFNELMSKLGNQDFGGLILVDKYGVTHLSDYVAFYFSPNSNIVIDSDGWFSSLADYDEEDWEFTEELYYLPKNVSFIDRDYIFDRKNWVLIWKKPKKKMNVTSDKEETVKNLDEEIEKCYNRINELKELKRMLD